MKLKTLLKNVECEKINFKNIDILNITDKSAICKEKSLFFCLSGHGADGHFFAIDAVKNGAVAIVCERKLEVDCVQIIVENSRKAMAVISANFFGNPLDNLKLITVVGTNGKSTTAYLIQQILIKNKIKTGLIGTSGVFFDNKKFAPTLTTPDPILLHEIFAKMVEKQIQVVVLEASAHAIYYYKLYGTKSEVCVFTNFSQDHLDFFKTMESYKQTKMSFFCKEFIKSAIINFDDDVGKQIAQKLDVPFLTFGQSEKCDFKFKNVQMSINGSVFEMNNNIIKTKLTCLYNIYNVVGAISCCLKLGIEIKNIIKAVKTIKTFEGRFEVLKQNNKTVVIDFAHTPKSLEELLINIKKLTDKKIICVFGCPGNRDELKRKIMGKIASKHCDFVVITSDNPRFENSLIIEKQIESGIKNEHIIIDNRKCAVCFAINMCDKNSIVVLAGKGSENYQDINGIHYKYNDKNTAIKFLKE